MSPTRSETATPGGPRVIHSLPGRIRIHVPDWPASERAELEHRVMGLPGVRPARANAHTQNVLVRFEEGKADQAAIIAALQAIPSPRGSSGTRGRAESGRKAGEAEPPREDEPALEKRRAQTAVKDIGRFSQHAVREVGRFRRRARIAVRGIDRDPQMAGRTVERLSRIPGVTRVSASQLTGRVLVEYSERQLSIQDLLSQVSSLELPDLPGEDTPSHPLDPAPLVQSTSRVIGSSFGLALVAARRSFSGRSGPADGGPGAQVAGTMAIIEGLPPVERRLEAMIGRNATQLTMGGLTILGLTFAGSPLGLAVSGAGALRLMTTVRARRKAWRQYEGRVEEAEPAHPGARIKLEAGERLPLGGTVLSGYGTSISAGGAVCPAAPGRRLDAGARVSGGPITVQLDCDQAFDPQPRSTPPTPTAYDWYLRALPPISLAFAALTLLLRRSPARSLTALLLVNPRAALIGAESADHGAAARVLRQGVTVVGSREARPICVPKALIIESPRVLSEGLEVVEVKMLDADRDEASAMRIATGVSAAAGSPWGAIFDHREVADAADGTFDGRVASAEIDGQRWLLAPASADEQPSSTGYVLQLRLSRRRSTKCLISLRLAPAAGLEELLDTCARLSVPVEVVGELSVPLAALPGGERVSFSQRDALDRLRELQSEGAVVAVLSDTPHAGQEFAEADLSIALSSGRSGNFAARVDLLAANLASAAAILEAGALRDSAVRDAVIASALSNVAGAAWGLGGDPQFARGSQATYVAALAAIGAGYVRLQGGERRRSVAERLSDPDPERFGRQSIEAVLTALGSRPDGLSSEEAQARRRLPEKSDRQGAVMSAVLDHLRSPLTGVLAAGAGVSFALGAIGDVGVIAAVIAVNTMVGVWQERQAGQAAETLERMSARTANVLRHNEVQSVDADELVAGDVIALASGDRVAADARLIEADELEVDEAALTGESVPVEKHAESGSEASRVVLEGSDVTVGTGRAVVIAVGGGTRMGATAAAVALEETRTSPLGQKLSRMFAEGLPVIVGGGLLVTAAGVLWRKPLVPQLALGASIAIGAVPEGLPLLAGVAQAAVARRLADRNALVRRLSAVEALGRVDVACTDKTGTLTEGRPGLTCVADTGGDCKLPQDASGALKEVLEAAALASPSPDSPSFASHPTDVVVVQGAQRAGCKAMVNAPRDDEAPFEPARGFHATRSEGRIVVKGAPEMLTSRCGRVRRTGGDEPLSRDSRRSLLATAEGLSAQGLRVLMIAEGPAQDVDIEDPTGLVALGYVGISDPLRPAVPAAVERCQAAGVRVMMLTGDHPATARAIAAEAGLDDHETDVLTGSEISGLEDEELDRRLEQAHVIARITPLDKLRIVEALQRRGHVVAMTGDGVNDAPALRLADVGVAMGKSGTDVAREAADMVLADDEFSTLVEAFVEGRGFWHNIRRALGLLLGGNGGEMALMIGAALTGLAAPLTTRQVLTVNLVTDVLPALSVAIQEPEHRDLASLSREGTAALDAPLRRSVLHRGIATAVPSFAAYLLASRRAEPARAQAVAFSSVVATQLAQTLDLGRAEGRLSPEVLGAVAVTAGFVAATLSLPPLQRFLGLGFPTPFGLGLCSAASVAAVAISRILAAENGLKPLIN